MFIISIIDSIKDKLGNIIFPKTVTKAVYDDITNKRLDAILDDKANLIDIPIVPTSLPANGGNADTVGGKSANDFIHNQYRSRTSTDFNTILESGFYNAEGSPPNSPPGFTYGQLIVARGLDTGWQICGGYNTTTIWVRGILNVGDGSFTAWRAI